MDLARAPRRTARKKGSGYENATVDCYQAETRHEKMPASYPGAMLFYCSRAFAWDAWINFPFFLPRVPSHVYKPKRLGTRQRKRDHVLTQSRTQSMPVRTGILWVRDWF